MQLFDMLQVCEQVLVMLHVWVQVCEQVLVMLHVWVHVHVIEHEQL